MAKINSIFLVDDGIGTPWKVFYEAETEMRNECDGYPVSIKINDVIIPKNFSFLKYLTEDQLEGLREDIFEELKSQWAAELAEQVF